VHFLPLAPEKARKFYGKKQIRLLLACTVKLFTLLWLKLDFSVFRQEIGFLK